jgi:soluble lytic murein transglycosylase-like protein
MNRVRVGWCAAAVALVVAAGCGVGGGRSRSAGPPQPATVAPAAEETPAAGDTPAADDAPSATTASSRPAKPPTRPPARATPAVDPNWDEAPACYHVVGPKIARSNVKAALQAAAGRRYWRTEAPQLRVNWPLVKAVAWQESGWQSNVRNCDGGIGVMQAMPATVQQMNTRFGLSYDASDYRDNAYVGANYLAWLTKYFGDRYFRGRYDLSAGRCHSHGDHRCLLNLVIAAYNGGFGQVDEAYAQGRLARPAYVDSVRSLMTSCYCDRF